jgi:predicted adenylyl cyclase CyaB
LGECGRVRKQRTLFLAGRTRIHLDEVEGLGAFMELEVVLSSGETVTQGIETAHRIMRQLGVSDQDLVDRAYVDLLPATT